MEMKAVLEKMEHLIRRYGERAGEVEGKIVALEEVIVRMRTNTEQLLNSGILRGGRGENTLFFPSDRSAMDFGKFFKGVCSRNLELVREATEPYRSRDMGSVIDSEGGYFVPEEWDRAIMRLTEAFGVIYRGAFIVPMRSEIRRMPRRDTGMSAYWIDQGTAPTETQLAAGQVILSAHKLGALTYIPNELLEDADTDPTLADLLALELGETFAQEQDRVGFNGDGTGGDGRIVGILAAGTSDVPEVTMAGTMTGFDDLTYDDLLDLQAQVVGRALPGCKYYMHRTIFNLIRKLKDDYGAYIWERPREGLPATIAGYPYELAEEMPALTDSAISTPFILFGNLKYLYFGERRGLTIRVSEHYAMTQDLTTVLATQRFNIQIAAKNAMARLKTAAA